MGLFGNEDRGLGGGPRRPSSGSSLAPRPAPPPRREPMAEADVGAARGATSGEWLERAIDAVRVATADWTPRQKWQLVLAVSWAILILMGKACVRDGFSSRDEGVEQMLSAAGCSDSERDCAVSASQVVKSGRIYTIDGIDAPRIDGAACAAEREAGLRARERLQGIVRDAAAIGIDSDRAEVGADPALGRASVLIVLPGNYPLSEMLLSEGLATPWTGAHADWCH